MKMFSLVFISVFAFQLIFFNCHVAAEEIQKGTDYLDNYDEGTGQVGEAKVGEAQDNVNLDKSNGRSRRI